jgi:alpha-methylacyl-CoA racemase
LYLLFGILCALWERERSGRGQVVDASILDGVNSLTSFLYGALARKGWTTQRGDNLLDGGRPWYDSYETKDAHYVSVGPIEARFYMELLERLGIAGEALPGQNDPKGWSKLRERLAAVFRSRTREEWCRLLEGTDACFAPVLSALEAPSHPQNIARGNFVEIDGVVQPSPAPRFSRTKPAVAGVAVKAGQKTREGLAQWGFSLQQVDTLIRDGIAVQAANQKEAGR